MIEQKMNKELFITKLLTRKLMKDVDISQEDVGVGKAVYNGTEVQDDDEKYFIELYCEIPQGRMQSYAEYFEESVEDLIRDCKVVMKDKLVWIICKIFKKNKNLKGFEPNLKDLELDIGLEKNYFVIQINLTADAGGING